MLHMSIFCPRAKQEQVSGNNSLFSVYYIEVFMMSKVLCLICFEICSSRGGEKGGNSNLKTKHREPLIL